MAQHPQHSRMLVDSRMRDIRRRVEVIQKKLADLQEMGVPCAFCYSSVRNTGSIFTLGDKRITEVIEQHRNEILCNLMEGRKNEADSEPCSNMQEIHLILPVLPAPLDDLGRATLQSMIIGILKDLGIRWSDPKPVWWPEDIPFVPPRSAPENFAGNWIHALKRILKSVYSYFSYDTSSYIASKLESQSKNGITSWDGIARVHSGNQLGETFEEEDDDTDQVADEDDDDGYDDDDDDANHTMADIEKPLEGGVANTPPTCKNGPAVPKPPTKLVSSFTVENILMGRQHSSSSCSNGSSLTGNAVPPPVSPIPVHSPTSTCPPASAQAAPTCTTSVSSSIVGVNWVSHPPVKYTKFTMLSPTAMSDEAQKKKKISYEPVLSTKSIRSVCEDPEASAVMNESITPSSSQVSSTLHTNNIAPANSILATRESATVAVTSSFPSSPSSTTSSSAIHVYPVGSLKEVSSSSNGMSTATARLCPLSVVTTIPAVTSLERKSTQSQGFSPPQQYVFIVPSNSVAVAQPSNPQAATIDEPGPAKKTPKSVIIGNSSVAAPVLHTVTSQVSQNLVSPAFSRKPSNELEKASKAVGAHSESNNGSFRLIAPKQDVCTTPYSPERGNRTKGMKRASQKPHKLRFHMTTVVTKQKREPVRGSMTVESPSAVISDMTGSASSTSPTSSVDDALDRHVAIESTITCSPNMYSADATKPKYRSDEKGTTMNYDEKYQGGRVEDVKEKKVPVQKDETNGLAAKELTELPSEMVTESKTKGRTTRNYTRRKRELTFHLYEDPGTAFRIKKACKE